ncbi:MAG TPA: hypothetical protein VLX90_22205 [Steroidobacteraceae bacterium]|nr:hypothetical protein [Steroidobacteraceae bacterium]
MIATLLALAAAMADRPAGAADGTSETWIFQAYVSLFVPTTVSGTTTFPPESSSPPGSSDVRVSDSLVNLNSAFVGGLSARHGRWGVYTDLIYMDVVGTRTGPGVVEIAGQPVDIQTTATARLGLRDSYGLVAGTYRLVTDPNGPLDLLFGGRWFDQHRTLDWQFSGNVASVPPSMLSGSRSVSESGWDAIAGVTGRFGPTGHGWFAPYYLDIGTGKSTLVLEVNAGVGYGWDWGELALGWRYMHYDNPRQSIESVGLNGPVIVILFRW